MAVNIVAVHGAWHTGAMWDQVAGHLWAEGYTLHSPTLAGYGPDADPTTTLGDAVRSLITYVEENDLKDVVLVGWSLGGVAVSLAAPALHKQKRLRRVVWHNAFVLDDKQSCFDAIPPAMAATLKALTKDGLIKVPFALFRETFCNDADGALAKRIYREHTNPQVAGMLEQPVNMKPFNRLLASGEIPMSYVNALEDTALPHGKYGWYPRYANRLGAPRVTFIYGAGHEAPLTAPDAVAAAYIDAIRD